MLRHKQEVDSTNCLQVCIACLLEVPVEEVSKHFDGDDKYWDPELGRRHLFHKFGYGLLEVEYNEGKNVMGMPHAIPCIFSGPSPRDPSVGHAVVGSVDKYFYFEHDPNHENNYIEKVERVWFLVPYKVKT